MLFLRQFPYFLGGHLKVFDYLGHVARSGRFDPLLYLTPDSIDASAFVPESVRVVAEPVDADAYFIAGANWRFLDAAGVKTDGRMVVNLLQGFRHLDADVHSAYLERAAIRICVSEPLAQAVRASERVNGPVIAIPNGIDLDYVGAFAANVKQARIFIAGNKNAVMARELAAQLESLGLAVDVCIEMVPRDEFLDRLSRCAVTIALPHESEGFYLPAIEAMAAGSVLVIPCTPGPAAYCRGAENCVMTEYAVAAMAAAARDLLGDGARRDALRVRAAQTAALHTLERERSAFYDALYRFASRALT